MKNEKLEQKLFIVNLNKIPDEISIVTPTKNRFYFIYISNKNISKEITINLNSKNSKLLLNGAIYLYEQAKCNLKINVNHIIGANKARVNVKTVLTDSSSFDFEGMIRISKGAHKSNSYLKQSNLLVCDSVICNTSPRLEIKADNVKASHGATVAGFNEDELFYLKSRGVSEKYAKQILEESFLATVFGKKLDNVLKALNISKVITN